MFICKKLLLIVVLIFLYSANYAQDTTQINNNQAVKWYTFEEAIELNKKEPRYIFIDVYTDWCKWCKKMDSTTYNHPVIIKLLNERCYAVKFNAEKGDTIQFDGKKFGLVPSKLDTVRNRKTRPYHELAAYLLKGKLSYPSTIIIDNNNKPISVVSSYFNAKDFEALIVYFIDEVYKKPHWDLYKACFRGQIQ